MFDFRKIEAFCKVYELRSFSKAGEALFLSQPTVSAHIQALERDVDVRLLDRMGRTVLPTPAGAVLYRYAKQAFSRLEAAKAEIRALASEVTGDLVIGSSSIPAYHVLPKVLTDFLRLYPKVTPSLVVSSSKHILRRVLEGGLMTGIVGNTAHPDPDLIFTPLMDEDIVVIAQGRNLAPLPVLPPLRPGGLPQLAFETAAELQWIVREQGSTTRRSFEEALRLVEYDPRRLPVRLEVDSAHAAVQYVKAGLGLAAVGRTTVEEDILSGELQAFALAGVAASRRFFSVINSRRVPFPAASMFLEFLKEATRPLRCCDIP